jgi:hypothetical protein
MKKLIALFALTLICTQAQAATYKSVKDYNDGEGFIYTYSITVKGHVQDLALLVYKCSPKHATDCTPTKDHKLADTKAITNEKQINDALKDR